MKMGQRRRLFFFLPIVAGEEGEGKTKDSPDLWKRADECMFVNIVQSF
jgi:hypothetical protein